MHDLVMANMTAQKTANLLIVRFVLNFSLNEHTETRLKIKLKFSGSV